LIEAVPPALYTHTESNPREVGDRMEIVSVECPGEGEGPRKVPLAIK